MALYSRNKMPKHYMVFWHLTVEQKIVFQYVLVSDTVEMLNNAGHTQPLHVIITR